MVLGITVARFAAILVGGVCLSCVMTQPSQGEVTDRVEVHGYILTLKTDKASCLLMSDGNSGKREMVLTPSPPCYFLRRGSHEPQSYAYRDKNIQGTLIVAGSPISERMRSIWKLPPDLVCGSVIQGVLIREKHVALSSSTLTDGVWCKDKGADEKNFWFFAHEK